MVEREAGRMLRLRWVVVIWIIGLLTMAYGVAVELGVREEVGSGARRFTAHVIASGEITAYREMAQIAILLGPGLLLFGLLVLRKRRPADNTKDSDEDGNHDVAHDAPAVTTSESSKN